MEKILNIDGKMVKFKSTGASLLRYKMEFRRDALQDFYKLLDSVSETDDGYEIEDINALELDVFYNLCWVLAKTGDPSIGTLIEWLDTFDRFPVLEILPDVVELFLSCLTSTVESKKKI